MNGSKDSTSVPRFRLAPTPSGMLHEGNAASFVLTWLLTRFSDGSLLLRIDDLDRERFRVEYLEDIFRTIDWLGIDYDIGPSGPDDFLEHWSQMIRMDSYRSLLQILQGSKRIYECNCSRSKLSNGPPCTCFKSRLTRSITNSIRFYTSNYEIIHFDDLMKGEVQCDINMTMANFVVIKKDQTPSYQVASLCDDIHFGITHIVRGEDLISSTAAQLALASESDSSDFSKSFFIHHPLITGKTGHKLSKSAGDSLIKVCSRTSNDLPAIFNVVGAWLGINEQIGRLDELRDASRGICVELLRLADKKP